MKQHSFLRCPQEVQLNIAGCLPQADLANLCLTSRSFNNLTQPLLYSTVQISWVRVWHPPVRQSFLLLETLLERPELCNYVRSLEFLGDGYVDDDDPGEPYEIPETRQFPVLPRDHLLTIIKKTGVTEMKAGVWFNSIGYFENYACRWEPNDRGLYNISKIQEWWADGTMALFLCLLPRLSRFSADTNWLEQKFIMEDVFRLSLCSTTRDCPFPNLESLKDLSIAFYDRGEPNLGPENTTKELSMFYLPNIQNLSITIDNPFHFNWPGPSPPNPSLLTSLEIHRLRECYLAPILSVTKNLEWLRYNWYYRPDCDEHISTGTVMLDTMAKAFLEVSDTLEELEITAEVTPDVSQGKDEDPDVIFQASLIQISKMSRLKTLQVPWAFVIASDVFHADKQIGPTLPTTLQHLTLTFDLMRYDVPENSDEAMIIAWEREYESGSLSNATSLKSISLPQSVSAQGWPKECQERIEALGFRTDLAFTLDTSLWDD